jgi:hypothetical protein
MNIICQSCNMPMVTDDLRGTNADESLSNDYCVHCFKDGEFPCVETMEHMVESCIPFEMKAESWDNDKGILRGLILEASLKNDSFIKLVNVTNTENKMIWFECKTENPKDFLLLLSKSMLEGWYANAETGKLSYVVFSDNIFEYTPYDIQRKADIEKYALKVGVSKECLGWADRSFFTKDYYEMLTRTKLLRLFPTFKRWRKDYICGVIEESLENGNILNELKQYLVENHIENVPEQPEKIWHINEYHFDLYALVRFIPIFEKAIKKAWYIHIFNVDEDTLFVIMHGKSFKLPCMHNESWNDMIEYGISIGLGREWTENIPIRV